jgi:very-short-patch-repair endonuclease
MSTALGNAANRVFDSAQYDFRRTVDSICELLASECESPIEIMIGAAFLLSNHISGHETVVLVKQGSDVDGRKVYLIPQYKWEAYRFDFAVFYRNKITLIECDGHDFHERTKEQAEHDRAKDRAAQSAGFHILRFTGSEIYRDPCNCAIQIVKFLTRSVGANDSNS